MICQARYNQKRHRKTLYFFYLGELSLLAFCCKFKECDSECVQSQVFTTLFWSGPEHV